MYNNFLKQYDIDLGKMSKKKKRKAKAKRGNLNGRNENFGFGPFKVEREGRMVKIFSHWPKGKREEILKSLKENKASTRKEIDEKINKLLSLIGKHDSLALLSSLSVYNCFGEPETYSESKDNRSDLFIEYAQSLILAREKSTSGNAITDDAFDEIKSLITEICRDFKYFYIFENAGRNINLNEEELRINSKLRFLSIRGDSFREHHSELFLDLFSEHNPFLKKHLGFEIQEMLDGIQEIFEQINHNIDKEKKKIVIGLELHEIYKELYNTNRNNISADFMDEFKALPQVKEKLLELESLSKGMPDIPFEINPNEKLSERILQLVSSEFGENSNFLSVKGWCGWPTIDSIIYTKPLIQYDGRYYCFIPQLLFRNSIIILEELIKDKYKNYFHEMYQKKRGEIIENKALEYFFKLLPGAKVYKQLFYWIDENIRAETDGIILYDTNLFIIEAKAGSWSTSARKGNLGKMKGDVKKLIDDAYQQALRTKEFITNNDFPEFENQDGSMVLKIEDKSKYENIFVVNVTAENLAHLSTHLNSLKALNLIQGKEWPWSVFLNDLRVISEIIDIPSIFLLYIKRRTKLNDFPQFYTTDELDFLMFFLKKGLYFEQGDFENIDRFAPYAYTEDLDRYYEFLGGRIKNAKKPRLGISREYEKLIKQIESTQKNGFSTIATILLSFNSNCQDKILYNIEKIKNMHKKDGLRHEFTVFSDIYKIGMSIIVGNPTQLDLKTDIISFFEMKMYLLKQEEWVFLTCDASKVEEDTFDFFIFRRKWEFSTHMEVRIDSFKKEKISEFFKAGKKISPNTMCPCGFGLKYKECCGK